jgi:hypothetical protein
MSKAKRNIIVLATGAAVGLSATAVVMHRSSDSATSVRSALRDGVAQAQSQAGVDRSEWLRMACPKGSSRCTND